MATKAKAKKLRKRRRLLKFNLSPEIARALLAPCAPEDRDELLILLDALAAYDLRPEDRSPLLARIYAERGKPLMGRLTTSLMMLVTAAAAQGKDAR
jgi:hypothetical protein